MGEAHSSVECDRRLKQDVVLCTACTIMLVMVACSTAQPGFGTQLDVIHSVIAAATNVGVILVVLVSNPDSQWRSTMLAHADNTLIALIVLAPLLGSAALKTSCMAAISVATAMHIVYGKCLLTNRAWSWHVYICAPAVMICTASSY